MGADNTNFAHWNRVSGINGIYTGPKGYETQLFGHEVAGERYYVDVNFGLDSNNGSSWMKPFKTLTKAMAVSHANIAAGAKGWAARNQIYYKGDNSEASAETLTTLAQKTDIIGIGSYDRRAYPVLIGNHVIAGSWMGCRFFNMGFTSPAAGGVIFTSIATVSGLAFYGCVFDGNSTTKATKGLLATGNAQLTVKDCIFKGKFSTTAIDIGTGAANSLLIEGNKIESGAIGITIHSGMTCAEEVAMIINNIFHIVTLVVDENSNKVMVGGNRGRTASDGVIANTFDYNVLLAWDNIIACAASTSIYPVLATIPT